MRFLTVCASVLGIAFMVFASAGSANAQASRTWVSGVGDDANPCSRTAPCKTFAGAISKTATGGEINCIDPGGFGAVTITKAISIICQLEAGVLVSGTNGIIVNTTGRVLLEGLDIEGLGTGLNGVTIIGASKVTIRNCSIRNFTQNGVNLAAPAGGRVFIINSLMINNNIGLFVQGAAGAANFGTLVNTILDSNTTAAIRVDGAANKITIVTSSLSGSPAAISALNSGAVLAVGPSNFLTGTGSPTATDTFK